MSAVVAPELRYRLSSAHDREGDARHFIGERDGD
jgi:hypothetical protein